MNLLTTVFTGTRRITSDQVIGPVGAIIRVYSVSLTAGSSASVLTLRNGFNELGDAYEQIDAAAGKCTTVTWDSGLYFTSGLFADCDANISYATITYAVESPSPTTNDTSSMQMISAENSTTPSITQMVLGTNQNAVRLWIGETPVTEESFYIYVSINGQIKKVRAYRWQGIILNAPAGASLAFGVVGGRDFKASGMKVPQLLTTPAGATGTANADEGVAGFWTPTQPHIVLPQNNSAFILTSSGTERNIFISEFDGYNWSPVRFVVSPSSTDIKVRCTYSRIALATIDASTISITAPTGSTIGGSSSSMTFGIVKTGTTYNVTANDEADLRAKMALAVAGDEIVLPTGTYDLTAAISNTTFSANNGTNVGSSGIIIRGATGNRADVVIKVKAGSQQYNIDNTGGTLASFIKDLTFDLTNGQSGTTFYGGNQNLENVRITGPQTTTGEALISVGPTLTGTAIFNALNCLFEDSVDDGVDGSATVGGPYVPGSRIRFIKCTSQRAGSSSTHQPWTTHQTLGIECYGCTASDATQNAIANGSETGSTYYWFFGTITPGARRCAAQDTNFFFGTKGAGNAGDTFKIQKDGAGYAVGLRASNSLLSGTTALTTTSTEATQNPEDGDIIACILTGSGTGRGIFPQIQGLRASFNVITATAEGFRINNQTAGGTHSNLYFYNNTLSGNTNAFNFGTTGGAMPTLLYNNATRGSTNGIVLEAGNQAVNTNNYNHIDPAIDADFVAGANDVVTGDAAVDTTTWFPTDAGNCDSNGDPSLYDWVGGIDIWGFPVIYKTGVVSRGARSIAEIVSGADVFPNYWV